MPSPADEILAALRAAARPVSGEALAERLGISRAAVFKHVETLRGRGYAIEAEHAQGYVLTATPDRLDAAELAPHLTGTWRRIEWRAECDSTQRLARELAQAGAEEGTAVFAETQTAGRGRLGRTWHSPPGRNVYCSIVLRPAVAPAGVAPLALVLGLAVARAVESISLRPALKWPNDVLLADGKVAGVLTEMEAEMDRVHVVIAGIGVNVNATADDFPEYLRDRATSLAIAAGRPVDRVAFAGRLLAEVETFHRRFLDGGFAAVRDEWSGRAALTGRRVTVAGPEGEIAGEVAGVDDDGALRLRDARGAVRRVLAGEVTIVS